MGVWAVPQRRGVVCSLRGAQLAVEVAMTVGRGALCCAGTLGRAAGHAGSSRAGVQQAGRGGECLSSSSLGWNAAGRVAALWESGRVSCGARASRRDQFWLRDAMCAAQNAEKSEQGWMGLGAEEASPGRAASSHQMLGQRWGGVGGCVHGGEDGTPGMRGPLTVSRNDWGAASCGSRLQQQGWQMKQG